MILMREIARTPITLTASPMELSLVLVKINGRGPYRFILDTGASSCCVSKELASELGIKRKSSKPATGANGSFLAKEGKLGVISIGRAVRRNLEASIFYFDTLRKVDERIEGIVGYNFLNRYIVTIDYERNALSLCKR